MTILGLCLKGSRSVVAWFDLSSLPQTKPSSTPPRGPMTIPHFKSELYQKLPLLNTRFPTQKNLFSMQGLNTNRAAENHRPIYGALIQKRWRFRKFPDTGCYLFPDARAKDASLAGPFQQLGCTFYWHGQPDRAPFSLLMPTTASVSLRLHQVGGSPPYLHTIREEYYPFLFVYGPSSTVRETRYRSWSWNPEDIRRKRSTKGVLTSSPRFSVMLFDISAYWAKCLALEWKCRILQRALEILLPKTTEQLATEPPPVHQHRVFFQHPEYPGAPTNKPQIFRYTFLGLYTWAATEFSTCRQTPWLIRENPRTDPCISWHFPGLANPKGVGAPTCTPTLRLISALRISRNTSEQTPGISLYFPGFINLSSDWVLPLQTRVLIQGHPRTDPGISLYFPSFKTGTTTEPSPSTETFFVTADIEDHPRNKPKYFVILS